MCMSIDRFTFGLGSETSSVVLVHFFEIFRPVTVVEPDNS